MQPINAGSYLIYFNEDGPAALNLLLKEQSYSRIFIITDSETNDKCLNRLLPVIETSVAIEIIEFENGEENKNIDTCVQIWNVLTELGADRKSLVINLGGGVVTDLGGFVASTFMRGIDFINIPTTLLAMVDAAVGGKNGVDLGHLKNQVGTITNPQMVMIDTNYLETLPQTEMRSGLAEMLKHGLIFDKSYWNRLADLSSIDHTELDALIYQSVVIKNTIVTQDLSENGIRKALNFGHTIGHAVEGVFLQKKNNILHGEAVAAGMVIESCISLNKGLLTDSEFFQVKSVIKSIFGTLMLTDEDVDLAIKLMAHDKKNEYGNIRFSLLKGIGNIIIDQDADNDLIHKAFDNYKT